ncbi:hypothetical protein [Pseudomonas aeruginosa]|uniref:hypothetical protein n=1 Tax=Pseudomonas aeruginosa TaxID=287 RepID=UPI00287FA631|nr:hypothetical protein [Pseudomonas aeruginosa]
MSEVKKISPVGNIYGWEESQFGEFVLSQDYDALAAEAQALREEVEKAQNALAFTEQWHGVRYERLWHWAHAELDEEQKRRYFNIVANGTAEHSEPPTYAQQLCRMKHRYECAEKEAAALRARVVVLPDASTVYAALDARERLFTSPENIQVALEAQSRLNGKTVSEGLLRKWLELMEHGDYREGHCMCGSPVDSHGIGDGHAPIDAGEYYAGQVMEELRALLNQDKENGNG